MTYRVLMVCTGNICRSAIAEVVLQQRCNGGDIEVDSAGISAEESGNPMDSRAVRVLRQAEYEIPSHQARQIGPEDLDRFDLILAMTHGHYRGVQRLAERTGRPLRDGQLRMYRSFDPTAGSAQDVPDPWYGGMADFLETLQTVEEVTPSLIRFIEDQLA